MSEKPPSNIPLTIYDQDREARFFRWLFRDKARYIGVAAEPQACLSHLVGFPNQNKHRRDVQVQADDPTQIEIEIKLWIKGRSSDTLDGIVTATIRENRIDNSQSDVILRVYPGNRAGPIGCVILIFLVIAGLLSGFSLITSPTFKIQSAGCLELAIPLGLCLILCGAALIHKRNDLLAELTTHLERLNTRPLRRGEQPRLKQKLRSISKRKFQS